MQKPKNTKAPLILACLALVCGGCSTNANAPPAPVVDPDNLRQSCIEQQEYLREHFPYGCRHRILKGIPPNEQCTDARAKVRFACSGHIEQSKDKGKTWACAEGHSCR